MAESTPISIDVSQLDHAAEALGFGEDDMKEILRLAMDDTAAWANKEAAKELGQELKVPYPAMRKRVKAKKSKGGGDARVWFGINDVSLKYLKPKQTGGGVSTTAKSVPGAFIVPKLNSHVFKRTGEKRVMSRGIYKGQVREVIEKQELSVSEQAMTMLNGIIQPKVEAYFIDRIFFYMDRFSGKGEGSARRQFTT